MDIQHEDGTKTRLTDYLVYKSNQKWKFACFFDAIGLGDALKENGIGGADDPLWTTAVGQEGGFEGDNGQEGDFEVDNETSEWNGKQTTRNVIKKYYKPER
ncbi:unknown [Dialister sp. CAG:486]|nr:unknown [Dialister sp. CAG:486]